MPKFSQCIERKGKKGLIRKHKYVTVAGLDTHYKCELCGYLRALNPKKRAKLRKKRGRGGEGGNGVKRGAAGEIGLISADPPQPPAKVARRLDSKSSEKPFTAQQAYGPLAMGQCCFCDVRRVLTVEHIVAKLGGGLYEQRNTLYSCGPCNTEKGTMSFEEWLKAMRTNDPRRRRVQYFASHHPQCGGDGTGEETEDPAAQQQTKDHARRPGRAEIAERRDCANSNVYIQ